MNALKTLAKSDTEIRVANYLVLFGGRDLAGEFFTKNTRFESNYTALGTLYVDFEHGIDEDGIGNNQNQVLGIVDWKSAKVDENGIYVERILNRRQDYMAYLAQLIDMGVMGTSSEALRNGVRKKASGEIVEWPLVRDSLTVTPMEPRMVTTNVLQAAKALQEVFPNSKSLGRLVSRGDAIASIESLASLGDLEDHLRDVGGFSRKEAKALVAKWKSLPSQPRRDADAGEVQELIDVLQGQRDADDLLRHLKNHPI